MVFARNQSLQSKTRNRKMRLEPLERRELLTANQFGAPQEWNGFFGFGQEVELTGNFDGSSHNGVRDKNDDVVTFARGTSPNVYVALSDGTKFGSGYGGSLWNSWFGYGQEIPRVGDFNGDGKDDVATFVRGTTPYVYVALSDGTKFGSGYGGSVWNTWFCYGQEIPEVGDFNGDGKADIATFVRGTSTPFVSVALSNGSSFNNGYSGQMWNSWFCYGQEIPKVGDFNGDGKADVATFLRGTTQPSVYVALSNGAQFGSGYGGTVWNSSFCTGDQIPDVGDFNGDGKADIVAFSRNDTADVFVSLSSGSSFGASSKWQGWFCPSQQTPRTGDFNRDGHTDIVNFQQGTDPKVLVSLAVNASAPSSYMLTADWGGTFKDAEKSPTNSEDDNMCWAAAASNVLAWTGWGASGNMTDADTIFSYFVNHWTDAGGFSQFGYNWWFYGVNPAQGVAYSQVDVAGGDFLTDPPPGINNYLHINNTRSQAMSSIDNYLHAGAGVTLWIAGPGSHVLTCWGFSYNPANPTQYTGIYVSDSDNNGHLTSPPDTMEYYPVSYNANGNWYLQNTDWYIRSVVGLSRAGIAWPGGDWPTLDNTGMAGGGASIPIGVSPSSRSELDAQLKDAALISAVDSSRQAATNWESSPALFPSKGTVLEDSAVIQPIQKTNSPLSRIASQTGNSALDMLSNDSWKTTSANAQSQHRVKLLDAALTDYVAGELLPSAAWRI